MKKIYQQLSTFFEMIKFEHTVFALPFAYLGMILAAEGLPTWAQFWWITLAMVAARTTAMSFNRLADMKFDARNPRTRERPLVSGKLSPSTAWIATVLSLFLLGFSAWQLNPLAFKLFPIALLFLIGYSYTKRFTWMSHFVLGFTDALAAAGAWVAVRGTLFGADDLSAWVLLFIVTLWIGGFDLIYACQDYEIDREENLHSIPARFGIPFALTLARWVHLFAVLGLIYLGYLHHLAYPYWIGVVLSTGLFIYEHAIISPDDLSRVNVAFFNVNGYISLILFFATWLAL